MCGRATLSTPAEALAELFHLDEVPDIAPRFNIAPGQPVPILRAIPGEPGARRLEEARWGIARPTPEEGAPRRPPWILVRVESLFVREPFREAASQRRAVVVVDGFYEWQGAGPHRQPFHFRRRDGKPLALASIWEPGAGGVLECALLTTAARSPVREVHDRMPILLPAEAERAWLDPTLLDPRKARPLAEPDASADLVATKVGTFVNDARHEGPDCLAPSVQGTLF